tara:strand:+ start:192 stop:1232 length:1041 start_codon:yes stop_codon:yes gene_type:complete
MLNIFFVLIIILIISILSHFFLKKKILLIIQLFAKIFNFGDYFFSFKLLSKNLTISQQKYIKKKTNSKIAIIIQGPIVDDSNFTTETIKFYLHNYPHIPIVISTWEGDAKKLKNIFKKEINKKIFLILNKIPNYSGYKNINLQAVSTNNAINFAKKLKCRYVLKTRSDIRLYSTNFDTYLLNLIQFYKLNNKIYKKQRERIISTSFTLRYRLYSVSDLVMFGNIKDLSNYFNIFTDKKIEEKFYKFVNNYYLNDKNYFIQKEFCPEIYFFSQFFKKINKKLSWTSSDYIKKLSENFIIIDNNSLSVYWKKSNKLENHFSDNATPKQNSLEFCFSDWFNFFYKRNLN